MPLNRRLGFNLRILAEHKHLIYSSRAAVTQHQRLAGLNNKNVYPHSSKSWKSEIKVPAGLVFSEASLLSLQIV